MAGGARAIFEAIPRQHQFRFVSAGDLRKPMDGLPPALRQSNHDKEYQLRINAEISKRISRLRGLSRLPECFTFEGQNRRLDEVAAKNIYEGQKLKIESDNRLSSGAFSPLSRESMLPFTAGMLREGDARKTGRPGVLFESPQDFLKAFDEGLELWRGAAGGIGAVGVLDVAGGAGTRAARDLVGCGDYAENYGVDAVTPRSLYPIEHANRNTFKGILINNIRAFSRKLGIPTPVFVMINEENAGRFADYVRTSKEAAPWDEDVIFWNQRVLQRFDVGDTTHPLGRFFPAGHGDNAILAYQYGILQAMKSLGIKYIGSSNGDEFLWYYLFPALIAKMNALEAKMLAIAVANVAKQKGGLFNSDGQLTETNRVPFEYEDRVPEVVNTTFYLLHNDTMIKGAEVEKEGASEVPNIVCKDTWEEINGKNRYINMVGADSWMGDEFSGMIADAFGEIKILEGPRNIFLGMKSPIQVVGRQPQEYLFSRALHHNLSLSQFYTMMANKVTRVLDVLLYGDKKARLSLAEQLFANNFELIDVEI